MLIKSCLTKSNYPGQVIFHNVLYLGLLEFLLLYLTSLVLSNFTELILISMGVQFIFQRSLKKFILIILYEFITTKISNVNHVGNRCIILKYVFMNFKHITDYIGTYLL